MGANEKYEATCHGYTPSLEEIRRHWGLAVDTHRREERLAEFDRMINKVRAEAWDEGREAGSENQIHWNGNWYTGGHEEITNPYKEAPNA